MDTKEIHVGVLKENYITEENIRKYLSIFTSNYGIPCCMNFLILATSKA